MLTLPDVIVPILSPFAMLFTNPTWQKAQLLLVGASLATGQRTVAAALRIMGRSNQDDFARSIDHLPNPPLRRRSQTQIRP